MIEWEYKKQKGQNLRSAPRFQNSAFYYFNPQALGLTVIV